MITIKKLVKKSIFLQIWRIILPVGTNWNFLMEIIKRTCLEQSKNFFYLVWINIKWKSKANDTFSWENRTNLKELDIQSRYTKQYGFCQHNFCSIKTKLCHETDKLREVANFKIWNKTVLPTPSIFKSTQSEFKRWIVKNLWLQLKN